MKDGSHSLSYYEKQHLLEFDLTNTLDPMLHIDLRFPVMLQSQAQCNEGIT